VKSYCWGHDDPDGGEIQDYAERIGLIVPKIATLQDTVRMDDVEVGDQIFVFADWMDCNDKTDAEVSVVSRLHHAAAVEDADATRAECFDCNLPYADEGFQDLVIEDADWRAISPDGEGNGLLCPNCINRRLSKIGIESTGTFNSGPLSYRNKPAAASEAPISAEAVNPNLGDVGELVERLNERARIRRNIPGRKSIEEGRPDRIADQLEEAATALSSLSAQNEKYTDAQSTARAEAREECAKVADATTTPETADYYVSGFNAACEGIADALRSLKDQS
jgi:hypothetical protein